MKLQQHHGQYLTTHTDEIPHLDVERPSPFVACVAALPLFIVIVLVGGMIAFLILRAYGPWRAPLIGVAILSLWMMAKGARQ